MMKLLLVEDDEKLAQLIKNYLIKQGIDVKIEQRGDKAVFYILQEQPALVILDINLPGLSGLEVCKTVRNQYHGLILILTARESADDHVTGLHYGADDYINKPVDPKVLLARIQTLTKRQHSNVNKTKLLKFGKLVIDLNTQRVFLEDKNIKLKPTEYDLLILLAQHAGKALSRDTIMQALRGIDYDGIDRSIDLRISYLRKKLNDDIKKPYRLITVRNRGYCLAPDAWDK
jgi:two-component system, OmpR family, response regulator